MNSRFGRPHPSMGRASDRDRKLFIAAAILAMSLVLVLAVVFKFKIANGTQEKTPELVNPNAATENIATITILAPERPVQAGTALADVRFKKIFWPRNQVPEGAIQDVSEIRGKYAKIDLAAGAPIQSGQLTDQIATAALPLTPGNRAVTINIDSERAIEYHVLPGTIVDVVLTHYIGSEMNAKIIVEKARVLSLGGSTDAEAAHSGGQRLMRSQTVTLDVSPKDALRVIGSKRLGQLSLLLRDQGDNEHSPVTEVTTVDIIEEKVEAPKARKQCTKGRVRIDGSEFIVHCDGNMFPVGAGLEP
ncbi:MAG: Flp pilus assembly protein CpaB [Bdellovibrionales bacterium]|nr:Flp pilus assembly protein CpaB [Bdellovibrionales bacterium]